MRRRQRSWRMLLVAALFFVTAALFVALSYRLAPRSNTGQPHFDALLVLGAPAASDGSVGEVEKWRMDEAIHEFQTGRAAHLIVSGGAVLNQFVEAQVMGRYALEAGIPKQALIEEPASRNTLENIVDSQAIMDAHQWRSVEVVSSPEHLPRAALLLQQTHLLWSTHAAPTPGRRRADLLRHTVSEALATAALRVFGLRIEPVLHRFNTRPSHLGNGRLLESTDSPRQP